MINYALSIPFFRRETCPLTKPTPSKLPDYVYDDSEDKVIKIYSSLRDNHNHSNGGHNG